MNSQYEVGRRGKHPSYAEAFPCGMSTDRLGREQGNDESDVTQQTNSLEDVECNGKP
jgi:hypothetical protein